MTQTAQHTQGPWQHITTATRFQINDHEGNPILRINGGMVPVEANARLIAAAPELLAALQLIVDMIDPYSLNKEGREARAQAVRAIWKAVPRTATNRPGDEAAVMHEETGID